MDGRNLHRTCTELRWRGFPSSGSRVRTPSAALVLPDGENFPPTVLARSVFSPKRQTETSRANWQARGRRIWAFGSVRWARRTSGWDLGHTGRIKQTRGLCKPWRRGATAGSTPSPSSHTTKLRRCSSGRRLTRTLRSSRSPSRRWTSRMFGSAGCPGEPRRPGLHRGEAAGGLPRVALNATAPPCGRLGCSDTLSSSHK
jgi:hypothetical protein